MADSKAASFFRGFTCSRTRLVLCSIRKVSSYLETEMHFTSGQANAAKYAYAASQIYGALRTLRITAHNAETIVLALGKGNEYVERVLKFNKRDSIGEMKKDLHNNLCRNRNGGVGQRTSTREPQLIIALTQKDRLVIAPYPDSIGNTREAIMGFNEE